MIHASNDQLTGISGLVAILVGVTVMLVAASAATGQCDFDRIGRFEEPRYQGVDTVALDGDRAYVFTPGPAVIVYDITDIDNPVVLRKFTTPGRIRLWTLEDGVLWVLDFDEQLRAYDTADSQPLSLIGSFDMGGTLFETAYQLNSEGSKIYLDTPDGFAVYSVVQPAQGPILLGTMTIGNRVRAHAIDESRGYLYSQADSGLQIFDISNPSQMALLTVWSEVVKGSLFHIDGTTLFIITPPRQIELRAWDMSDVYAPVQTGIWTSPESDEWAEASDTLVWDNKLYFWYRVGYWEYDYDLEEDIFRGISRTIVLDLQTLTELGEVPFFRVDGSDGPVGWRRSYNSGVQGYSGHLVDFSNMLDPQNAAWLRVATGVSFADETDRYIYGLDAINDVVLIFDGLRPELDEPIAEAPLTIEVVSPYVFAADIQGIQANDGYLLVKTRQRTTTVGGGEIFQVHQLYDFTDPTQFVFVRTLDWDFNGLVEFDGAFGYRLTSDQVIFYDWSDLLNPIEVSSYTLTTGTGRGRTIALGTGFLFVMTDSAIEAVDISDLFQPVLISTLAGDFSSLYSIAATADTLLVLGSYNDSLAFHTFDVSDPYNMIQVGAISRTSNGFVYNQVRMFDDLGIFNRGAGSNSRSIHDTSDLSVAPMLKRWSNGAINGFFIRDGILFSYGVTQYGGSVGTIRSFDLQGSTDMAMLGSAGATGSGFGVSTSGDLTVLSSYDSGIYFFDTSDPADPFLVGSYDTPDRAYETVIIDGIAYVADGSTGLLVLDVSEPSSPVFISSLATSDLAIGLAVEGGFAFMATRFDGLQIIAVSNPASPVFAGSVDTPGSAQSVTVAGDTVYVADGSRGVQVVDITSRSSPVIVGSYDTPHSARQVYLQGTVAYVPDRSTGLLAIDVSDRTNPQLIGTASGMTDARSVTIWGHLAFVVDFDGRVHLVDATTPSEMQVVQTISTLGTGRSIVADGKTLYVADGDSGLTVLEARPCWYRPCPADLIEDGLLDFFDLQAYLNAYSASDGLADWNDDGQIDFFDLQQYLLAFSDGCP